MFIVSTWKFEFESYCVPVSEEADGAIISTATFFSIILAPYVNEKSTIFSHVLEMVKQSEYTLYQHPKLEVLSTFRWYSAHHLYLVNASFLVLRSMARLFFPEFRTSSQSQHIVHLFTASRP